MHIDQDTRTGGLADRAGALAAVDGGDSRSSRPDTADGRGALLLRLDRLPDGHPSSPRHANGTCKPADLGLYDIDEARPLTDAEHAEHVRDVRERLDKARADGLASHVTHTIDPRHTVWSADRDAEHDAIIADLYAAASAVPCERQAILAGGLPGAGKTTVLARYAGIDRSRYLTINPDDIKVEMARRGMVPIVPGLTPMEATDLVHEESSHIAKRLASRAMRDGKNIIWDVTMSSRESTESRITDLRAAGYERIDGIFVDIPVEASIRRADDRHRSEHDAYRNGRGLGGRIIPAEIISAQHDPEYGCRNRRTFEQAKPLLNGWSVFDNSVSGREPARIEPGGTEQEKRWPAR